MQVSDIVEPVNGRDEGKKFFIINIEGKYAYLANGKGRPIEKPKRKKMRHIKLISHNNTDTAAKIRSGLEVQNSEIRRALAVFAVSNDQIEGGL